MSIVRQDYIVRNRLVNDAFVIEKFYIMPDSMFKTKVEAINELVQYDHCFLTPEAVKEFCKPFKINPQKFIIKVQDNRSDFKGLYVPNINEGDWVEGADASSLAEGLCQELEVTYRPMFGRGSRLRECCQALKAYCTA